MSRDGIFQRMQDLGVNLPEQPAPRHPYRAVQTHGGVAYLSGKTAMVDGVVRFTGALGESEIEKGRDAARLCVLNLLSTADDSIGLENVQAVLKLTVFVSSELGFFRQPDIANAASQLLIEILGEAGHHARSAIGVGSLPGDSSVEIEAILQFREEGNNG